MNSFEMLHREWRIFLAFILIFICSYLIGQIFFALKKELALKWAEKLDKGRVGIIKVICNNINKPYGVLRVILIIFIVNLIGGAFIWSSIGGIFIIIPFLHNMITGFLTSLVLKRYPERVNWLTIPNIIFEIVAFMCAAIGGIKIGLSIFGGGNVHSAIVHWAQLFITIVIPLQFIAAIFEGLLFYRIHIVEKNPWPYGICQESEAIKNEIEK